MVTTSFVKLYTYGAPRVGVSHFHPFELATDNLSSSRTKLSQIISIRRLVKMHSEVIKKECSNSVSELVL